MTHDELLDKALVNERTANGHYGTKALREIVELHKPFTMLRYMSDAEKTFKCQACSVAEKYLFVSYPCETIQAIEGQLG